MSVIQRIQSIFARYIQAFDLYDSRNIKIIQHLQITDENYPVALSLLDKEFLDKAAIVDELFRKSGYIFASKVGLFETRRNKQAIELLLA